MTALDYLGVLVIFGFLFLWPVVVIFIICWVNSKTDPQPNREEDV